MVQGEDARVRLARPDTGEAELAEVAEVLESGTLTMGPKVAEFEAELLRHQQAEPMRRRPEDRQLKLL